MVARAGDYPGSIIRNLAFDGYRAAQGTTLQPGAPERISLADYYDPELRNRSPSGAPYRMLHITVSCLWCTPCNEEAKDIVALAQEMSERGVLFLTALADGPVVGKPAEIGDLNGWILRHRANTTHVLDPFARSFSSFFDVAAGSFNANIDLRSMEILYGGIGKVPNLRAHVEKWLAWTEQNPARAAD